MFLGKQLRLVVGRQASLFRNIVPEDVTQSYIDALMSQKRFISNNPENIDINWQQNYIRNILMSKHDTICGLFIKSKLIGTSGIQGIRKDRRTNIGIFVLEETLRGKGYGKTLVWSSCFTVNKCFGIDYFMAGMRKENLPSMKAFLACGFEIVYEDERKYEVGVTLDQLHRPESVKTVNIVD